MKRVMLMWVNNWICSKILREIQSIISPGFLQFKTVLICANNTGNVDGGTTIQMYQHAGWNQDKEIPRKKVNTQKCSLATETALTSAMIGQCLLLLCFYPPGRHLLTEEMFNLPVTTTMDGLVASSLAIHALMDESTQTVTLMASVVSAAAQEMLREMMEHQLAFIKIPFSFFLYLYVLMFMRCYLL